MFQSLKSYSNFQRFNVFFLVLFSRVNLLVYKNLIASSRERELYISNQSRMLNFTIIIHSILLISNSNQVHLKVENKMYEIFFKKNF